ncbi:MAG TPA: hypothetical protein VKU19_22325 [Bryobacteraceae bacterium]|nr:hypothetical protein [Bryobacteraceae bacterium]
MFTQNDIDTYQFIRGTDLKHRETAWSKIYLDTTHGKVHVVQRWQYSFTVAHGMTAWTDDEKLSFHYALSSAVTGTWDSQTPLPNSSDPTVQDFINLVRKVSNVRIGVTGLAPFAKQFAGKGLDIDFDIVLTGSNPHWHVTLEKVPSTSQSRANVNWDSRRIHLFSIDNSPSGACQNGRNAACTTGFVTTPHEFGHTMLNDDEYTVGARSRSDLKSIMNIGNEVRPRHYSFIAGQLNHMVPGCTFRAML